MIDRPTLKQMNVGTTEHRRLVPAYEASVALKVCEAVAEGETLKAICSVDGMPARQTFYRWMVMQPELARAYAAAREISAHSLEEEALTLAREIRASPESSAKVRAYEVAMNQYRWSAARRNPRVYSERGAVQITVPIQIITPLDMGAGMKELGGIENVYTIEATVTEPTPEPTEHDYGKQMQEGDTPLIEDRRKGRPPSGRLPLKPRRRGQYG